MNGGLDGFQWVLVALSVLFGFLGIARLADGRRSLVFNGAYVAIVAIYVLYAVLKAASA